MASEFDIIKRHFMRATKHTDLAVGDDAALLRVSEGCQLAISTDMLVAGTHFFVDAAPYDIGWKALAVNVSDMAAMGANPRWATMAIALENADEAWLAEFARGFFACAEMFDVDLIGGDTTKGTLNISVTIMGEVPTNQALRRNGAKIDDDIWVSGHIGSAALGLAHLQGKTELKGDALQASLNALLRPIPRIALGLKLRGIANSAIDISDGLVQDLGHIVEKSNVGAKVFFAQIPKHPTLQANKYAGFEACVLSGGDDYELCFTAPRTMRTTITKIGAELQLPVALIGNIHADSGLAVLDENQQKISSGKTGYDHFRL